MVKLGGGERGDDAANVRDRLGGQRFHLPEGPAHPVRVAACAGRVHQQAHRGQRLRDGVVDIARDTSAFAFHAGMPLREGEFVLQVDELLLGAGQGDDEVLALGRVAQQLHVAAGKADGEDRPDERPEDRRVVRGAVVHHRGERDQGKHDDGEDDRPAQRKESAREQP